MRSSDALRTADRCSLPAVPIGQSACVASEDDALPPWATVEVLREIVRPFIDDVRRTLDPTFTVDFRLDDDIAMFETRDGGASIRWSAVTTEADWRKDQLVILAERIPDCSFDDVLEPWPQCPQHRDDDAHPLYPAVREGRAMWVCRRSDGGPRFEIGRLP
jgi:hypothetical protein